MIELKTGMPVEDRCIRIPDKDVRLEISWPLIDRATSDAIRHAFKAYEGQHMRSERYIQPLDAMICVHHEALVA